jgi:foldase protein PrsA
MQYGEDYKANEDAMVLYNDQREKVLNYLIETQLVLQDAASRGIEVDEQEVEDQFNMTKLQFESDDAFAQALAAEGMTADSFKSEIRTSLIINAVILQVTDGIEATDEEIERFYTENQEGYMVSAGAEMAHILVATEEEAKQVKQEYDGGTSFEDLAATYGTDGTKDIGGALGFITYDSVQYDADFLAGAKDLEEGQVSEPVPTQFGWHLIKVTNVQKEAKLTPLEEVRDYVAEAVITSKQMQVFNDYLDELRASTPVEMY